MATYDLLLDTGIHADEGLGVAFSRAAATVGLGGEARASGAPRYAAELAAIRELLDRLIGKADIGPDVLARLDALEAAEAARADADAEGFTR